MTMKTPVEPKRARRAGLRFSEGDRQNLTAIARVMTQRTPWVTQADVVRFALSFTADALVGAQSAEVRPAT